jgi:lipoprotein-releasing system ATP-binding protein
MSEPVVACRGLRKAFKDARFDLEVLRGIDLTVQRGERIAIVGASGTGKSTLLHILGGLDQPTAGSVTVQGENMSTLSDAARGALRNRALGFVYQFHHLLPEFSALENVAMPLLPRSARANCSRAWGWASACRTSRASCPAASASARRWRGRWSRGRPACWRTSRRATSTPTLLIECSKECWS